MTREHYNYAEAANAHTPSKYKKAVDGVAEFMGIGCNPLDIEVDLEKAAIECENLYRTASLIAYGNSVAEGSRKDVSLAGISDIDYFTKIDNDGIFSPNQIEIQAVLPRSDKLNSPPELEIPEQFKKDYQFLGAVREVIRDGEYQVFSIVADGKEAKKDVRKLVCLLGNLIANYFTRSNYVGVFDGKVMFKEPEGIRGAWYTLAQLSNKESPSICPACGKVIDRRRRNTKGGKPSIACKDTNPAHIDMYHNEQKKLEKTDDPKMQLKTECAEKARELRWCDKNNKRPYQFLGIEGMGSDLEGTGQEYFREK